MSSLVSLASVIPDRTYNGSGKGGGCILVLHGRPGTGKTLTAESVAELLQRPLYIISSGQLGTDAIALEANLKSTLELAERWSCVTLIDEADVFLEARSEHALVRNGLVAVFLRLLESFSGVLFLTTNRVSSFDEAFISRFSVAIKYNELDKASRHTVWSRFLKIAGVTVLPKKALTNGVNGTAHTGGVLTHNELEKLADNEINGRVIKQVVRAAQALSISRRIPLSYEHLELVLTLQQEFEKDFKSAAEINYEAKDASWSGVRRRFLLLHS
jgi:SpoVK/Ycf46/Vps4 family AAA+-type ATPase